MSWIWFSIITAIAGIIFIGFLLYYLAEEFDLFFTLLPEGQIRSILRGKRGPRFIASIRDHAIDQKTGEIFEVRGNKLYRLVKKDDTGPIGEVEIPIGETDVKLGHKFFEHQFGLYWVGIPPFRSIHTYRFEWNKWKKTGADYKIEARDEPVKSMMFRYPYPVIVKDALTSFERRTDPSNPDDRIKQGGNVPIQLDLLVTIEAVNVEKALFRTPGQSWLANTTAAVQEKVRDFIGRTSLGEVISMQYGKGEKTGNPGIQSKLTDEILFLNFARANDPHDGLVDQWGIRIIDVNVLAIEILDQKVKEAVAKAQTAAAEAEETIKKAEGRAKETRINADAEKDAIIAKATGEAEAIQKKGEAEAKVLTLLVQAMSGNAVAYAELVRSKNLAELKQLQTLVESGGRVSLMLQNSIREAEEKAKESYVR